MSACDLFRARLERTLADRDALRALGWHEHLFTCDECRTLLEGEEALELLLDALPRVELPDDLTARLLARLEAMRCSGDAGGSAPAAREEAASDAQAAGEASRELALDRLLSRDHLPTAPEGLGRRVLHAVQDRRAEAALESLLERVPIEPAPADLARRIVDALEGERVEAAGANRVAHVTRHNQLIHLNLRWTWAAAALALLALGVWVVARSPEGEDPVHVAQEDAAELDVDAELLASLDVLENWELLLSQDVDVQLGGLGSVGGVALGVDALLGPLDDGPELGGFGAGDAAEGGR